MSKTFTFILFSRYSANLPSNINTKIVSYTYSYKLTIESLQIKTFTLKHTGAMTD